MHTRCGVCPLRRSSAFHPRTAAEIGVIQSLKWRERQLEAGDTLIAEGRTDAPLHTLLRGWAIRFRTVRDGRRQILNILLPGDLIGVQQRMGESAPGVSALTDSTYCVFQTDALWELHRQPRLGLDVTVLMAHEESHVDERLLSVGRGSARERIATLLVMLFSRAKALGLDDGGPGVPFPLTQQHIADALGLSLVHTNKSMRKLEQEGHYEISGGRLHLPEPRRLARVAALFEHTPPPVRPLI